MNTQNTTKELESADRIRHSDPQAALRVYASADPSAVAVDDERLLWVTQQIEELAPENLHPLLEHAVTKGTGLAQRRAAHLMAIAHWYDANPNLAESLWLRAVELGRDAADQMWAGCLQNLAMAFSARGRSFESLVLLGMAVRAAQELGDEFSQSFALIKRATTLVQFEAFDAAESALRQAEALWDRIDDDRRRHNVKTNALQVWSSIYNHRKQWEDSLRATQNRLQCYEDLAPASTIVLVSAHSARICTEFELESSRRGELIEELEGLGDQYGLQSCWRPALQNDVEELRLRHAIEDTGDRTEGLRAARVVLDYYRENVQDDDLITRARRLGRSFTQLDSVEDARASYDLAATAVLERVVQIERANSELPEVAEATSEDLQVLNQHRHHLVQRRSRLYESIVQLWRPGNPAFDLVVGDDELVHICAWCERVRTTKGNWIPVAQFFPDTEVRATHGMCASCHSKLA